DPRNPFSIDVRVEKKPETFKLHCQGCASMFTGTREEANKALLDHYELAKHKAVVEKQGIILVLPELHSFTYGEIEAQERLEYGT
ncbi:MAG: hypothetical protein KGI38_12270, partial [Thaumarchaeota archaeon]|nr:hypothetical protein [Nitrososphaerota archaeon]